MAQANEPNTTNLSAFTRRMLLRGAAVMPIAGLPAAASTDPIFAAIENHRTAQARFSAVIGDEAILDDDPRIDAASGAEEEAAIAILDVSPLTIAGVIALLRYAAEHQRSGDEWPAGLVSDSDDGRDRFGARYGRSWSYFMHLTVADALASMGGQ